MKSPEERIKELELKKDELAEKRKQLTLQQQKIKASVSKQRRKDETRGHIIIGACLEKEGWNNLIQIVEKNASDNDKKFIYDVFQKIHRNKVAKKAEDQLINDSNN